MNENFEHKKQGELLKLGLAEAKDAQKHIQSSVRILSAVADYYQRRTKGKEIAYGRNTNGHRFNSGQKENLMPYSISSGGGFLGR